jgi:hypothetical protein
MKKALVPALLLVLGSVVLGATVFPTPLATAAGGIPSMFVANDNQHPLPVEERNVDAAGNIKVHEQGTADVNVTNATLPMAPPQPVTGGGGGIAPALTCPVLEVLPVPVTATALQLAWSSGIQALRLRLSNSFVAEFWGPARTGDPSPLVLPLTRPVTFDVVECFGTGELGVFWVGNEP